MSDPDLLERMRMAVSDCGYDPADIMAPKLDGAVVTWLVTPDRVVWQALQVCRRGKYVCWRCSTVYPIRRRLATAHTCTAYLPCTEDCGAER